VPRTAVTMPPALKESLLGAKLTKALAGATMLAAILVLSVATSRPAMARNVVMGPLFILANSYGLADIACHVIQHILLTRF